MIFQHTWQWLFEPSPHTGELKTLTSRIVKPGDYAFGTDPVTWFSMDSRQYPDEPMKINSVWNNEHLCWQIGKTYAIQPARTQKAIGRFALLEICEYDVRDISEQGARAEGFARSVDFLMIWCRMHDKGVMLPVIPDYDTGLIAWADMEDSLSVRPAERYQAWQLRLRVNR